MWPAFFAGHHGAAWTLWPAWNGRPLDALFAANGQSAMQDIRVTLGKVRAGPWAMEAARLESGGAGRFVALFCNKHDSAGTNGPQHYCKLSYEAGTTRLAHR